MKKKVIIIGGGLAGLSCGINLLKNNFDVELFEKNNEVGGLCSGYLVNGHYIDGCIHWLTGTKRDNKFNDLLRKMDCLNDDVEIISLPTLGTFIYKGEKVTFYRDIELGEDKWISAYPDDKENIHLFYETLRSFCELEKVMDQHVDKAFYFSEKVKKTINLVPSSKEIFLSMKLSRKEYASRFKSKAIQNAIINGQNGFNSMFFFFMEYAMFINGNADIPSKGAKELVARAKAKFLELGGKLHLNTEITLIIKHEFKVLGVKTKENVIYVGDIIVSCLDPHYTYRNLFQGNYYSGKLKRLELNEKDHKISSSYNLYLAVKDEMKDIDIPTGLSFEPMKIGANEYDSMFFRPYRYEDCYKNNGKTVASILVDQSIEDFKYFNSLSEEKYKKEIERINNKLIDIVISYFPYLKGKIEIIDFFGPKEIYQRTYSKGGAILSYSLNFTNLPTPSKFKSVSFDNFYLASQWNSPIGGTPNAINNGYLASLEIIKTFSNKKYEK